MAVSASSRCIGVRPAPLPKALVRTSRVRSPVLCKACGETGKPQIQKFLAVGTAAVLTTALSAQLAIAAEIRLPPVDNDPNHCERAYQGNGLAMGLAGPTADKLLDLRQCNYENADLNKRVLSGGLLADSNFRGANMQDVVISKGFAMNSDFTGADLSNTVLDRVEFIGANLTGAKLSNAVVTSSNFEGADLTDTNWEDALVSRTDVINICRNPTMKGESRLQLGCRN